MDPTPRVSPSDFQAQQEASGGLAAAYASALSGSVSIDLTDAGDLALVSAGTPKDIDFYNWDLGGAAPSAGSTPVSVPLLTCFTLVFEAESDNATLYLYDRCAEIELHNSFPSDTSPLARAWLWDTDENSDLAAIKKLTGGQVILSYEGPPILPVFRLRCGMVPGLTHADQAMRWNFKLYPQARPGHAEARISIPDPCSLPPFYTNGGYLFKDHPVATLPGSQPLPVARQFRASVSGAALDLKLYGGPWKVQSSVYGPPAGDLTTLRHYRLASSQSEGTYSSPLLAEQVAGSPSLDTEVIVDALRVTSACNSPSAVELLCTYP